jgi:pimeloyl-ACP methyl ester carboxylesterase
VDSSVETEDGRELRVQLGGAPDGAPVVYHMGTPTSRLIFPLHDEAASRHGVRLVSYDRPGYGGSTPRPGRTAAGSADDVRAIADALGLERFGLWGFSGGGPFVLGAAAGLGERVTGAVVLASPAFSLGVEEDYDAAREELLGQTADDWRAALAPEHAAFAEFAIETLRIALADGPEGWQEDEAAMADWGFELESISTPVRIRHGGADKAVPVEHGELLGSRIPGSELLVDDEDGHQAVHFRYLDEDFAWLAAQASATA